MGSPGVPDTGSPDVRAEKHQELRRPSRLNCQFPGCSEPIVGCKDINIRCRICEQHLQASSVTLFGVEQRFCLQCGKFHLLDDFDGSNRSCREKLNLHNLRRRMKRRQRKEDGDATPAAPSTATAVRQAVDVEPAFNKKRVSNRRSAPAHLHSQPLFPDTSNEQQEAGTSFATAQASLGRHSFQLDRPHGQAASRHDLDTPPVMNRFMSVGNAPLHPDPELMEFLEVKRRSSSFEATQMEADAIMEQFGGRGWFKGAPQWQEIAPSRSSGARLETQSPGGSSRGSRGQSPGLEGRLSLESRVSLESNSRRGNTPTIPEEVIDDPMDILGGVSMLRHTPSEALLPLDLDEMEDATPEQPSTPTNP